MWGMREMTRDLSRSISLWGTFLLNHGKLVKVPTWQALDVRYKPQGVTYETMNASLIGYIPPTKEQLQHQVNPSLPWAENHFQERVSGKSLNPGETYKEWPWYKGNVETHKEGGKFSHTYMERYWPKGANRGHSNTGSLYSNPDYWRPRRGIRFAYGDLNDVIDLLAREPTTRQAYLPVWFPEDTGAVHKERVPCSLGYLFLLREKKLHITYYIRSCDFYRHFRDDVYLTARLCQWVLAQVQSLVNWTMVKPGTLTMHIGSLHVFEGDLPKLRGEYGSSQ